MCKEEERKIAENNMSRLSLSMTVKLALILSLSLTPSSSYSFQSPNLKPYFPLSLSSSPAPAKSPATAGDVLALLGPNDQASIVDPDHARELRSCFKFLVPFQPDEVKRRSMVGYRSSGKTENEHHMIWWPPAAVLELARLAFDSGGDPDAVHRILDPSVITVPDVEGSNEGKCQLTRTPYGRRFISEELNVYIKFLFELIVSRGPSVGLNVSLSRYDFFHGHLFISRDTRQLGILFHAKEYPAYDDIFPYNLGYCQRGSNMVYDDSMNLRNILWLAPLPSNSSQAWETPGVLVALDARPEGIIYRDLIPDYVQIARTLYEDDFGKHVVDVNYLNVGSKSRDYQLFIC